MTSRNELYAWLGRRRLKPNYVTHQETDRDGTTQFVSVLSVDGFALRTEGRASRRAAAEEDAACKFILLLRSQGKWDEATSAASPATPAVPGPTWDKTRPVEDNLKSLLNLFLQKNGTSHKYDTKEDADGRFQCRLTIQLKQGRPIDCRDTGSSKVRAELACASRAIDELELRGLMDRSPADAQARAPSLARARARAQAQAQAQADGPGLGRSASLPEGPAHLQWDKTRPMKDNPRSLLNEFLQKNGIQVEEDTGPGPNGKFVTRLRIDLQREHGVSLVHEAYASSKSDSKKECADKVIRDLESRGLIDRRPGSALSDAPGPSTVSDALNSLPSSISSVLQDVIPSSTFPSVLEEGAVGGRAPSSHLPFSRSELIRTRSADTLGLQSTTNFNAPVIINISDGSGSLQPVGPPGDRQGQKPVPQHLHGLFESCEVISEDDIQRASRQIGALRKTIGLSLGLTEADIENCMFREDDAYEVHRRILRRWREKESRNATLGRLCRVLWDCKAYEAVVALKR